MPPRRHWTFWLLAALLLEKVVQHAVVTTAFVAGWSDIRGSVAVDYRWLAILGAVSAVLFAVALAELLAGRNWSLPLAAVLALADVIGECIAQGTLAITINVSVLAAVAVLVLARVVSRQGSPVRQA